MTIADALKRFRKSRGLKQSDVAEKLGITAQSYYRYEKNDNTPSAEIIKKIAYAFGVSADYLLGLTDMPNNNINEEIINAVENCYRTVIKIGGAAITGVAPPHPCQIVKE